MRPRFSLSTLMLLIALSAVLLGWWMDHDKEPTTKPYDLAGPITAQYEYARNGKALGPHYVRNVLGVEFRDTDILIYTESGGKSITRDGLTYFEWFKKK